MTYDKSINVYIDADIFLINIGFAYSEGYYLCVPVCGRQSCEMSQIWQLIYLCKNIET